MNEHIWNKNIAALDSRYEKLKTALMDKSINECDTELFELGVEEVADKKVLFAVKDGVTFQLDSLYDSSKIMNLWIENQTSLGYMTKCIFCGLGTGNFVKTILEQAVSSVKIMIYEPSFTIFKKVCEEFDISAILSSGRVTLIVDDFFEDTFKECLYTFVDYRDLDKLIYQSYPNYDKLMLEKVKESDHEIQIMYNTIRATQGVMARYGEQYFYNSLINAVWLQNSKSFVDFFRKIPKDVPAIIVSSGPSLDKNVKELKKAKGKSFIIAVDSAVKALISSGVVPDIFVTIDGRKLVAHFSEDKENKIPMICGLTSNRLIIVNNKKQKFFINDLNPYVNDFMSERDVLLPVFSSGGSVANTAFSIADSLGFEKIILVGQDLAYTDKKTHSKLTVAGAENYNTDEMDGIFIEGYCGDEVKTSYEFQLYLKWFEEQLEGDKITAEVINATEGGARIRGTKQLSLNQAIEEYCKKSVNIEQIIADTDDLLSPDQKMEFKAYMYNLENEFRKLFGVVEKCLKEYKVLKKNVSENKLDLILIKSKLGRTSKIVSEIESASAMYYIQNKMQKETSKFLENVYMKYESPKEELIGSLKQGIEYLSIIKRHLEKSITEVEWILDKYYKMYEES